MSMKELRSIHFQILLLQNQIGFNSWIKVQPNCGDNFFFFLIHQNFIKELLRYYANQLKLRNPWLKRPLKEVLVKKKKQTKKKRYFGLQYQFYLSPLDKYLFSAEVSCYYFYILLAIAGVFIPWFLIDGFISS